MLVIPEHHAAAAAAAADNDGDCACHAVAGNAQGIAAAHMQATSSSLECYMPLEGAVLAGIR